MLDLALRLSTSDIVFLRYCIFNVLVFSARWLESARCPAPRPDHEIQVAWCASVCCQVADFAGQPLSRHRAIGLPPDVRVSCQVVTIAPQWPRRLCGLSRHRAIGSWMNAWSCRGWAKLRRSHVLLARLSLLLLSGRVDSAAGASSATEGGQAVAKTGSQAPSLAGVGRGQRGGLWSRQLVAGHPSASQQREAPSEVASGDGRQPRALGVWGSSGVAVAISQLR